MINWGEVALGTVLPFHFPSYDGATGASEALSGLAVTDIEIYKAGGGVTQRSSDSGYALIDTDGIDIDSIVGANGFTVDTGDNTDAGFFVAGGYYIVWVSAVTIDVQTVNLIAGTFKLKDAYSKSIGPVLRKYNTLLVTGTTALQLPIDKIGGGLAGSGDWTPAAADTQVSIDGGAFADTTNAPTFNDGWELILTAAELSGKNIRVRIVDTAPKAIADMMVTVETFGHASAMYPTDLSVADVAQSADSATALADIQSRLPAALVSGRMDASVGAMAANVLTAAATAADFSTEVVTAIFGRAFSAAYGSHTFDELIKLMAAVLLGKTSGAGTATVTFRNLADNADTVVATMSSGDRSTVTKTP